MDFMQVIRIVILVLQITFAICYSYQVFYIIYMLIQPQTVLKKEATPHRFAVLISARNESAVIGQLLNSIRNQTYPRELVDVYVIADNCTDNTGEIAEKHGAKVYVRNNLELIGKGYALDFALKKMMADGDFDNYDAFMVFDADNILEPDYIEQMNKVFSQGHRAITSYRNSKNFDDNWITGGYSTWFLRESKYLNNARMNLHTSCAISGTGFLVHHDIFAENGGWKHHLLTEDIEFSIDSVIKGERIAYCPDAVLYDEQPITFKQSWNQRLRWAKGFYQVFAKYGGGLFKSIFKFNKGSFAAFDMLMSIFPALFLTIAYIITYLVCIVYCAVTSNGEMLLVMLKDLGIMIFNCYLFLYAVGLITIITEWKRINTTGGRKILVSFSFPLFLLTYIPIAIVALFKKVTWTPIKHGQSPTKISKTAAATAEGVNEDEIADNDANNE